MKMYKVYWGKRAIKEVTDLLDWYLFNKGTQFVATITKNIDSAVYTLSHSPEVGRKESERKNKIYRSILTHPKTRILYWYDNNSVHIVRIISTLMHD